MRLALAACVACAAGACGAGDEAACLEDEAGDLLGGGAGNLGQDRGVGVGGEHDGGVAHHVLHDLQFHPGGNEGGGAMAKIVQADGRQSAGGMVLPAGAYVVKGDHVRWVPAVDVTIIVLASLGLVRVLARILTGAQRRRDRR